MRTLTTRHESLLCSGEPANKTRRSAPERRGIFVNTSVSSGHSEASSEESQDLDLSRLRYALNISSRSGEAYAASLPFGPGDVTAGTENELQTVVVGDKTNVDITRLIMDSNYYKNAVNRVIRGDVSSKLVSKIEEFINENHQQVWENSWVRLQANLLNKYSSTVLETDLLADKSDRGRGHRKDMESFFSTENGKLMIRLPVSYLLKLALADVLDDSASEDGSARIFAAEAMKCFLNDNTSPEVISFYPSHATGPNVGTTLAKETLRRHLLTQCLVQYANRKFRLTETGQHVVVYFSPHPPLRQQMLGGIISDSFYRTLYMSPCLSGWDKGEEKHEYMHLCHQVLSRSRINTLIKLKESGIITSNLVIMPTFVNTSLANNGMHISLGSIKTTALLGEQSPLYTCSDEKAVGDLVTKITEHFLPLFVGTYSAAPYRLDYCDFHPEKALGFLPHELDYTHLRMFWRRWKKRASIRFFGRPFTPTGLVWLDKTVAACLRLRGAFVPDYRLLDYLVSPLSSLRSPALNGQLDNHRLLGRDWNDLGIFDQKMSVYQLCKIRSFQRNGFSGFENRYYSVCESLLDDMAPAVAIQQFITALAHHYVLSGQVSHADIPDTPFVESERRQIFFCAAAGVPTFYVLKNTTNKFLTRIIAGVKKTRWSHRYPKYQRVTLDEYREGLIRIMRQDMPELVEAMNMGPVIDDLAGRIKKNSETSAIAKLNAGICQFGGFKSPMSVSAHEYIGASEKFYREKLRLKYTEEAFEVINSDCTQHSSCMTHDQIAAMKGKILNETATAAELKDFTLKLAGLISSIREQQEKERKGPA